MNARRLDPHTKDRPEPIEIMARMAGRSNFPVPRTPQSSNTISVTPLDIAHAAASVQDKLGAAVAMAMACQRPMEWPRVERLGHGYVLHHLRAQRRYPGIVDGHNTYRARIALYDAFHTLVNPASRMKLNDAAAAAKMRRDHYRYLIRETTALLEARANTAARDAVTYLFSLRVIEHPLFENVRAVSINTRGEIQVWTSVIEAANTIDDDDGLFDIALLTQEFAHRSPTRGLLSLRRGATI